MVGRNKRTHPTSRKEVETVSEEEEVICLDVPIKQSRKGKTVRNFKGKKAEKKPEGEENAFAGFDVDGVSAEEKEQIREAILASTKEQEKNEYADTNGDESGLDTSLLKSEASSTSDFGELGSDTSKVDGNTSEVNTGVQEMAIQDDDETQPPSDSDIEEIQFGLNLDQSTLEESRDNIFDTDSTCNEDTDVTLKDDILKIGIEDVESDKKRGDESDLEDSVELLEKTYEAETSVNMSGTETPKDESKVTEELNASCESQGFDPDMQNDVEKDVNTTVIENDTLQPTEPRQRTRRSVSRESWHQSDLSKDQEKISSQKSSSRESMDSVKDAAQSSRSKKRSKTPEGQSSRSNSQDGQVTWEHVPLKRHYRRMRPEFQTTKHEQYFRTSETEELEKSALAIYQLFEIYRKKLHVAQRKLREKVTWPDPIKSGQHQSRTIDIKKRGKDSIYVDLSDDDENVQEKKIESVRGQQRNLNNKGENDSDNDLPELVIESENSWESLTRGRLARKPLRTKAIDKDIMSADTQPYDIDNNDDEDFVIDTKTRPGRGRSKAGTSKDNFKEKQNVGNDKENEEKPTRGRPGKRLGLNGGKSDTKVLVEDTQQEDLDLQEAIRRSKSDSQRSVEETQIQDDDFDWLTVNRIGGKEEFENQMHKAKLKGYSIPKVGQKHSKSHQKIICPENKNANDGIENELDVETITETKSKCQIEEGTGDSKESKPPTRGRKRKAKGQQGVTLVEDTQDLDDGETGQNKLRGKRKRNCFKIESDSEEEIIAESQNIDGPSEHDLDDKKQLNKGNNNRDTDKKSKNFVTSFIDKVKNFVSPAKSGNADEDNEEGSQSPVISRKKLYNCASKKVYSKPYDKNDAEYETDAFKEYKANSAEKKFKNSNTSSTNTRKGRVQMHFAESDLIEENGIPEGVKRFINRPSSKESNASDNLSTTSSQMSTNILDEKGDLYSTQYCEIKTRKGKDLRPKGIHKQELKEEVEEVLLLDESDEEIPVLNEPKKTYNIRKSNKKLPVIKGVRVLGKTEKQTTNNENIKQYFSKVKKPDDDVTIDLDVDSDEAELRNNDRGDIKGDIRDTDYIVEEGKHLGDTARSKSSNIKNTNKNSTKVHIISVPDIATEHEVENVKADINHTPFKFKEDSSHEVKNKPGISKGKVLRNETNTLHHLDIESDNPPVMLNDLNAATRNRMHDSDQNNRGARPKTRNIDIDADIFEPRPVHGRRRKVSETITSAEYEEGARGSSRIRHGDQDLENYLEMGHLRNGSRKRAGGHHIDDEDNHVSVKKKMECVECPLCGRSYPANVIQQHAATCEGEDADDIEEDNDGMNEDEYIAHMAHHYPHMSQKELIEHLSQKHHMSQHNMSRHHQHHMSQEVINEHLSRHNHMAEHRHFHDPDHHHLNHMEGLHGHHGHPEALHGHGEHLHDTDEAVSHFVQHDEHVKDIAKHISCSPGEDGELQSCYICDAQVPKGKPYEIHLNRCLTMAQQQQAMVDKKGYNKVFVEPEEEDEVQVRVLRGRQVNNEGSNTPSRGGTPRGRQYADDSPVGRRRQKPEIGFEGAHEDDGTPDRGHPFDPEDMENPAGAAKRAMKRGNRNKATLNDEGSSYIDRN